MRVLRMYLGVAIMFAAPVVMGPLFRLTNDIGLRFMLLPVLFAVVGVGFALMLFNGREDSN
jgi:ABC-type glycerol-3-phosphate transport system permease component